MMDYINALGSDFISIPLQNSLKELIFKIVELNREDDTCISDDKLYLLLKENYQDYAVEYINSISNTLLHNVPRNLCRKLSRESENIDRIIMDRNNIYESR